MNLRLSRLSILAAGVLLLGAGQASANSSPYTFSILGPMNGAEISLAGSINSSGQVVGGSFNGEFMHTGSATRWTAGVANALDTAPVPGMSSAYAINNAGQVAGDSSINSLIYQYRATVWSGGTRTYLASPDGSQENSTAWAINNRGQVAGWAETNDQVQHATLWNNGVATYLGTLDERNRGSSRAYSINDRGHVVGQSVTFDSEGNREDHGVFWSDGAARDLGTTFAPVAINNADQVVGFMDAVGGYRAALWSNGVTTVLDGLGEGAGVAATDINNSGAVVGYSSVDGDGLHDSQMRAVLWSGGEIVDLNSFLGDAAKAEGWVLRRANGINDSGWIIGTAFNNNTFEERAFQLSVSAVPEPETYAMLLAGLGLLGFVARRRKAA